MSAPPVASAAEDTADLLIGLLLGTVAASQLAGRAAALGIPLDGRLRAFRARPVRAGAAAALLHEFRRRAGHHWIGAAVMGGDAVGLTTGVPCVGVSKAVVGVGPETSVLRVSSSFTQASRAFDAAWSARRVGTFRLDDVALDAAVVADDEVGTALEQRYLTELDSTGCASVLEETVLALIAHNLNVPKTAAALGLHRNSVRYRLRQFERATGADLTNLEDVFGVWWALQRRRRIAGEPRVHALD